MSGMEHKRTMLGYDIDLGELWRAVNQRRRLVIAVMLGSVLLALVYLHVATYRYTATLMVSPVTPSSTNGLSSKLGSLGSLASLAGVNIGADAGTQAFMMYQEGLYSRDVADLLAQDPQIMHTVFQTKWDAAGKRWIQPSAFIQGIITFFQDVLGLPSHPWQPPDAALLQDYIVDNVNVDANPDKPVVTITYADQDPQFAVTFLRELDRAVDNKLRSIALSRSNQYIGYLSGQLNTVANTDVRQALMATLTDQENTKMMASVTAPYAAQPFGPPSHSRKPTYPKTFLVLGAALPIGALFGGMAALWLPRLRWSRFRIGRTLAKPSLGTG